ncbi:hypothetical protein [Sciscionella marina]|uniref:hypothetical protein n=1 Tax=Sciscionella marina TaxID=508770 RepID=UPI0003A033AA|nr:hypothetical protein [Sciscionella marina]
MPNIHNDLDARITAPDGSWAHIALTPDSHGRRTVIEAGPTPIWSTFEENHARWTELIRPGWERLGMTIELEVQRVWLDDPDLPPLSWNLPCDAPC